MDLVREGLGRKRFYSITMYGETEDNHNKPVRLSVIAADTSQIKFRLVIT
jgi:hypothetical protein